MLKVYEGIEFEETLDLNTAYVHKENSKEYVRIGVVEEDAREDGTISLMLVHFDVKWRVEVLQCCLNEQEIDMTIAGLKKARSRLREVNSVIDGAFAPDDAIVAMVDEE